MSPHAAMETTLAATTPMGVALVNSHTIATPPTSDTAPLASAKRTNVAPAPDARRSRQVQ
jgi:hypothetical protein